jgi:hypothetical protein
MEDISKTWVAYIGLFILRRSDSFANVGVSAQKEHDGGHTRQSRE